jgi:hypothetical protein
MIEKTGEKEKKEKRESERIGERENKKRSR